jgi:hypothetical protein
MKTSLRKRIQRWFDDFKWPLIGSIWIVAIVLGYEGFKEYFSALGEQRSSWDIFYLTLQLFTLESGSVSGPVGWKLQVARLLAPAMTLYTAAQALAIVFREQLQLVRARSIKNHIVICGLGRKGLLLAQGFRERWERIVIIEQDEDNGMLGRCRKQGVITLIGNATDQSMLRRARVHKASHLISVCGDDGTNAEVAVHARELVGNRKRRTLSCLVHIVDPQLCDLLRQREIGMGRLDAFRLEFFNVFETGARVLLDHYPPGGQAEKNKGPRPHMVVVGVGRMGESLVVNAARNWRERQDTTGKRFRITLIDREAEKKKESLCLRYPSLERVCELIPIQVDIQGPEFQRAEFLFDRRGRCDVTMIYVCLDDESRALAAALNLHERITALEIPIVVRMTHDAGLATLLQGEKRGEPFTNLHAFGLLDRTCTPELVLRGTYEILARAMHEDYVYNEKKKGVTPETNPSIVPWDELPDGLQESNRRQAEHIRVKLEAAGCSIALLTDWDAPLFEFAPEEVEMLAEMEHERFVKERLRQGWKRGTKKNLKKKRSPTLIPWDELPEKEKAKDRNTIHNLPAFLARAGFQIYRINKGG